MFCIGFSIEIRDWALTIGRVFVWFILIFFSSCLTPQTCPLPCALLCLPAVRALPGKAQHGVLGDYGDGRAGVGGGDRDRNADRDREDICRRSGESDFYSAINRSAARMVTMFLLWWFVREELQGKDFTIGLCGEGTGSCYPLMVCLYDALVSSPFRGAGLNRTEPNLTETKTPRKFGGYQPRQRLTGSEGGRREDATSEEAGRVRQHPHLDHRRHLCGGKDSTWMLQYTTRVLPLGGSNFALTLLKVSRSLLDICFLCMPLESPP